MTAFEESFLERIVSVNWGGGNVLFVLELSYTASFFLPVFSLSALPFTGATLDPFASSVVVGTPPIPTLVDPATDAMISNLYLWNRQPPKRVASSGHQFDGRALLFLNVSKSYGLLQPAQQLTLKIGVPDAFDIPSSTVVFWVVGTSDSSVPDPSTLTPNTFNHKVYGTVLIPAVFTTSLAAENFRQGLISSFGSDISSSFVTVSRTLPSDIIRHLQWTVEFSTYKNRRNFPSNQDPDSPDYVKPLWNVVTESIARFFYTNIKINEVAQVMTITVNAQGTGGTVNLVPP